MNDWDASTLCFDDEDYYHSQIQKDNTCCWCEVEPTENLAIHIEETFINSKKNIVLELDNDIVQASEFSNQSKAMLKCKNWLSMSRGVSHLQGTHQRRRIT